MPAVQIIRTQKRLCDYCRVLNILFIYSIKMSAVLRNCDAKDNVFLFIELRKILLKIYFSVIFPVQRIRTRKRYTILKMLFINQSFPLFKVLSLKSCFIIIKFWKSIQNMFFSNFCSLKGRYSKPISLIILAIWKTILMIYYWISSELQRIELSSCSKILGNSLSKSEKKTFNIPETSKLY